MVNFFQGSLSGNLNDASISQAIETLEYEFITGIRTVSRENTPTLVVYVEGQRVVVNVHIKKDDARALGQALLDEVAEPTGDDDEVDILLGDDEGIDINFPFDADVYRDGAL